MLYLPYARGNGLSGNTPNTPNLAIHPKSGKQHGKAYAYSLMLEETPSGGT